MVGLRLPGDMRETSTVREVSGANAIRSACGIDDAGVVAHILWRVLLVGGLLIFGALASALTYRGIAKRFA